MKAFHIIFVIWLQILLSIIGAAVAFVLQQEVGAVVTFFFAASYGMTVGYLTASFIKWRWMK